MDPKLQLLLHDADRGVARAQRHLANRYLRGRGVPQDLVAGAEWMRRAAEQGLSLAERDYAELLERGIGVEQNTHAAEIFYRRAADQGDPLAKRRLGRRFPS